MNLSEKEKVVHIITGLNTGGAERALYNLLNGGLSDKFDTCVISLMDEGTMGSQIKALGVPVISLGMKRGFPTFSVLKKLRKEVRNRQPDLIQGWMYHGNLAATLACSMCSKKTAVLWNVRHSLYDLAHEKLVTRQVIRANRFFSKSVDTLLYNSKISRQQHEAFGFKGNRGQVVPNGIDLECFRFSDNSRKRIRKELAVPVDTLVIGHVARYHPMKDHVNFLQAALSVTTSHPNIHFVLIGRDVSLDNSDLICLIPDSLRHQFHFLGERIDVPDFHQFHFLGERIDVPDLMSAMDMVSSSSSYGEAFPNVVGEAMAASLPCVVTDVGDSAYIVGETGVVVPPRDSDALAVGIESLLVLTQLERQELGEKARQRIEDNFALTAIVEQYSTLYKTKIEEKRNKI